MAILNTPLLGLPYAGADTDETYAVLAGLFVKDGQKLTLPEIVERYTPTIGTVYIKAADWTAADGTADAYDAKITISGVEPNSMILIYPATDSDAEKAKRLGIRAKAAPGAANDDTFVIVRATGGDTTVTDGISLVYIALRGYAVWSAGLTPPALPYATVIGVDPYIATEEGDRDDIAASQRLVTRVAEAIRKSVDDLAKTAIDKTVNDLVNYYNKSQTLTKDEINALVSAIPKFKIEVVTALPTSNISETTVYLVKSGDDDTNLYTEYIRAGGKWEKLGTQTVDLTGYATEAWVNDILAAYVKTVDMEAYVTEVLNGYLTKEEADKTYQPAGDYLTPTTGDQRYAKPSDIPTVPQTLPNPYALTILGKTYTGGKAVSLTAEEIMEAIKTASGGVVAYLDGNRLVLSGNLPDATYTAYYEVNGDLIEIGDLTLGSITPDPVTYTIRWVNYGGEVLKTVTVAEGDSEPEYDGPTPTRAEDGQYTYTFKGWDKTVDDATGDVTYTATYTQTAKPTEPDPEPIKPKNFATPSAWVQKGRIRSNGEVATDAIETTYATDFVDCKNGDVIYISNAKTNHNLLHGAYSSSKGVLGTAAYNGSNDYFVFSDTTDTSATVTIKSSSVAYMRFTLGEITDTKKVVINIMRNGEWRTK